MNELTEAQKERLYLMMEECSEVIKACSKILRYGYDNVYDMHDNRSNLEYELGDVVTACKLLEESGDIKKENVKFAHQQKFAKILTILRHQ